MEFTLCKAAPVLPWAAARTIGSSPARISLLGATWQKARFGCPISASINATAETLHSFGSRAVSPSSPDPSRMDQSETFTLDSIRRSLIRQEDTIIFYLLERAQYSYNADTYNQNKICIDGYCESLVEFMVRGTEKLHKQVLHPIADSINVHEKIWDMYFHKLLPRLAEEGSDGNCGATAVCDTLCLQALLKRIQALLKRIHYGKFVAEAKFRKSPIPYETAIRAHDANELMNLLTIKDVKSKVTQSVETNTRDFGQGVISTPVYQTQELKSEKSYYPEIL